ncbi:MAG: hypothetical protein H6709_04090 [Kofleriaceae bacterium]|nr:hypothetical protein [Myxococcales bacterium]MCB9560187.1 hypothetical protein [Kofleriaceae bacterium]MCB9571251.1 hypothetical protein [Kofleriaceae bacterium]
MQPWQLGITAVLALGACSEPTGPCLVVRVDVACCDAHDGQPTVELPSRRTVGGDVDLIDVVSGGVFETRVEIPADEPAGTAQVTFTASGDGQESFAASGAVELAPKSLRDARPLGAERVRSRRRPLIRNASAHHTLTHPSTRARCARAARDERDAPHHANHLGARRSALGAPPSALGAPSLDSGSLRSPGSG